MKKELLKTRLKKITSDEKSQWVDKAEWRLANKGWLKKSAGIAVRVLLVLKEKGITQKELAEMMSVSPQQINKIVKGQENLTLETLDKLERALGISLFELPGIKSADKEKEIRLKFLRC
jgi:ribosome-binding protein aMBF1 (putative translation factor)